MSWEMGGARCAHAEHSEAFAYLHAEKGKDEEEQREEEHEVEKRLERGEEYVDDTLEGAPRAEELEHPEQPESTQSLPVDANIRKRRGDVENRREDHNSVEAVERLAPVAADAVRHVLEKQLERKCRGDDEVDAFEPLLSPLVHRVALTHHRAQVE